MVEGVMQVAVPILGVCAAGVIGSLGYTKAKPDEVVIISGLRKNPKYLSGGAAFKIPFLEQTDKLTLRVIKSDVKTQEYIQTKDYIFVKVDAVATIQISSEADALKSASEKFLNSDEDAIRDMITDILEANTREIVSSMKLEEMVTNRQGFIEKVQENAVPDMEAMGLKLLTFNVQNFEDKAGVIEDMGIENTTRIKKNAAITKAESERDIAIAQSNAKKEANDVRTATESEIAQRNTDLAVKESQLEVVAQTEKAKASAAFAIQEQEQRKTIEISTAEANLAKTEKEIEIQAKAVEVQEKLLDSEIRKKAEADRDAEIAKSDAEKYKELNLIEVEKARATNEAEVRKIEAGANSEAIRVEAEAMKDAALAEAEGIKAKLEAEADGIRAKAEAMKQMEEAAVLEMFFDKLPEITANVAKPLESIESITMYGDGNTAKMVGDITKSTSQIMSGLTDALGIDMKSVISGFIGGKISGNTQKAEESLDITEGVVNTPVEDVGDIENQEEK